MKILNFLLCLLMVMILSGCASMRSSSSFTPGATRDDTSKNTMLITTGDITDRPYTELGVVKVAVKKLTAFNPNPTTDDANLKLEQEAKKVGGDAVIKVKYTGGATWDSWGAMKAEGVAVKFK